MNGLAVTSLSRPSRVARASGGSVGSESVALAEGAARKKAAEPTTANDAPAAAIQTSAPERGARTAGMGVVDARGGAAANGDGAPAWACAGSAGAGAAAAGAEKLSIRAGRGSGGS